ncbi:MarR family winged helix-turn-helix transcriptional regulator [Paenarthrobacter sp. YIM B13468]|uniref:MarR family winged helix-turn-helix transcriptional regulator n=1 Tax=Paenarthrobacter sp. YIM B13468 TaxID=3366295 RepID=UPI003670E696
MERETIPEQLTNARPDLDISPVSIISRLIRGSRLASIDLQKNLSPYDLEVWEFDVLARLRTSGPEARLSPGRLATLCMISASAMTNRLDRLVARSLVQRKSDPQSRRQLLISLTDDGVALVDTLAEHHAANQENMLQGLTSAERIELANLLDKFLATNNKGLCD